MTTASGGPIRVLIVDDNPRFGELAEMFLEEEFEDIRVRAVTSAAEGEEVLSEAPVDCVVSDYQMPERDGVEFLRAVREDHPDLPFIIMTGKGDETVASEAISATDVFPGIEDTEFYEAAAGVLEDQEVLSVEEYYDLLDAWFEVRIFPDVDGLSIYFRDISERKRRRQELERSRKRYRALVDTAPTAIAVIDADDGSIVELNQSAESLLGYDSEALSGESHTKLHPPEDEGLYETLFRERLESGAGMVSKHADGSQVNICTADGERIPVEISSQVIELEDERLVQSVIRDVVKRS